jgi:hypothetical protein
MPRVGLMRVYPLQGTTKVPIWNDRRNLHYQQCYLGYSGQNEGFSVLGRRIEVIETFKTELPRSLNVPLRPLQ